MPTAPGVNEATFASEPDPTTHMIDSNVTGIAKAARKIPTTASLQSHERNDGRNARAKYSFGRERITPPCFAFSQSFFTCFQKMRPRSTMRKAPLTTMRIVVTGFSEMLPEVLVERARHGQEEVEVDEGAGDREEDLLDEVGGDRAGERASRDDGHEHDQRHERADVRGQEVVHRHAHGVGGDDRPELDLTRIGRAQDAVVREPGEEGLAGLEDKARRPCIAVGTALISSQRSCSQPITSTPSRFKTTIASAIPTSQAPTLIRRLRRDGSWNGCTDEGCTTAVSLISGLPWCPSRSSPLPHGASSSNQCEARDVTPVRYEESFRAASIRSSRWSI